jgi:hypothetical protein
MLCHVHRRIIGSSAQSASLIEMPWNSEVCLPLRYSRPSRCLQLVSTFENSQDAHIDHRTRQYNSITACFGVTTATTWFCQLAGPRLPSLVTHPEFLGSRILHPLSLRGASVAVQSSRIITPTRPKKSTKRGGSTWMPSITNVTVPVAIGDVQLRAFSHFCDDHIEET